MTRKRIVLIGVGVLILLAITFHILSSGGGRYRADSFVVARPLTNTLMARSFELDVVRTIPGVLRLRVAPTISWPSGSVRPASPNVVGIRILAVGSSSEDAQRVANDAAAQLCRTVLTNYGVTGEIADVASSSRRYSYFHDSFQPAVERMFKH